MVMRKAIIILIVIICLALVGCFFDDISDGNSKDGNKEEETTTRENTTESENSSPFDLVFHRSGKHKGNFYYFINTTTHRVLYVSSGYNTATHKMNGSYNEGTYSGNINEEFEIYLIVTPEDTRTRTEYFRRVSKTIIQQYYGDTDYERYSDTTNNASKAKEILSKYTDYYQTHPGENW